MDQTLSPSLQEKITYLGALLKSFPQCEAAIEKLLDLPLVRKRIERLTERIGAERVAEADAEIEAFLSLTLTEKVAGPAGITPPPAGAVLADGGRYQRNEKNPRGQTSKTSHWFEYKAALCQWLFGRADGVPAGYDASDPQPEVPEFLRDLDRVDTLTRQIGQMAAGMPQPADGEAPADIDLSFVKSLADLEQLVSSALATGAAPAGTGEAAAWSPKVASRDVVATTDNAERLGVKLAARAWHLGLFQAPFKAFVADGGSWLWSIYEEHFKPYGFTPVVDIIHAVTHLYAAAMAGRARGAGAAVYQQWVTWLWGGELSRIIAALAARQAELGLPEAADSDTSPRVIVSSTLTYFQNQQSRMRYPEYRKLGLPLTSSHMESTIKELNYRIKGSEKFWGTPGAPAVLQLRADQLSDSDPLEAFWSRRQATRTGLHNNVGRGAGRKKKQDAAL